jgi:diguanylate cyclase (GGDEF)-like protein
VRIEHLILMAAASALAAAGILVVLVLPRLAARRSVEAAMDEDAVAPEVNGGRDRRAEAIATGAPVPTTLDRVVRVVSLLFFATAGIAVTASGAFEGTQAAIYFMLAAATLGVVFVSDLVPDELRRFQQVLQVVAAILVVTALVAVTGGVRSPFVAGYFLIVAGAALSSDDRAPTLLAIGASLAYVLVAALVPTAVPVSPATVAWTLFDIIALGLLAYIATVAGRQQRRARRAALRLAHFDALTGLFTRNHLFDNIEQEIARATRIGRGFCLLMLDLDDLKPINDTFGHQVGDGVLRAMTAVIRRTIRQTDLAGRYGGDEFLMVLPETDAAGALIVAEKLRADIAAMTLRVDTRTFNTSVSIGLVSFPEDGDSLESLMASVDAAMYESKRRGKNQIVGYVTRSGPADPTTPIASDEAGARATTEPTTSGQLTDRPRTAFGIPVPALRAMPGVPRGRRPTLPRRPSGARPGGPDAIGSGDGAGIEVTVADVGHGGPPADRRMRYRPSEGEADTPDDAL